MGIRVSGILVGCEGEYSMGRAVGQKATVEIEPVDTSKIKAGDEIWIRVKAPHLYYDILENDGYLTLNPITISKETIVAHFPQKPIRTIIEDCLNYCWHRLAKHKNTGLHKMGMSEERVDELRKSIVGEMLIPKKRTCPSKKRIDRLDPADFCLTENTNKAERMMIIFKLNELIEEWNK